MLTHEELKTKALTNPDVQAEYEKLSEEFNYLDELLHARRRVGLTQAQVAERMGTKPPAVARLESNHANSRHSPSIATLRKYAHAVGCKLEIHLVPQD